MEEPAAGFLAFAHDAFKKSGVRLRGALPEDFPLLAEIYASTRAEELQLVPWSAGQLKAFTDWQSAMQEQHYTLHYPRAERLIIEREQAGGDLVGNRAAIGRIYVETTTTEVRLMEITLLPGHRNQGIGTRVLNELLRYADGLQCQVSLHVEPFNPAKRMYERMAFVVAETRGLYEFMVRAAPGTVPCAPAIR